MKKYIALLLGLVVGLGFVSCSGDDDDNENDKEIVKPQEEKEKYLAETNVIRYDWKNGKRSNEGIPYAHYVYNEKGQLVSEDLTYAGYRYTYAYNAKGEEKEQKLYYKGNLCYLAKIEFGNLSAVTYIYNPENRLVLTYKSEFSQDNKLMKYTAIVDSISSDYGQVVTYTYNGNTKTLEYTDLKDGSFKEKYIYEYDSHGNKVKETIFNAYDVSGVIIEFKNEYDSKGRLISHGCDDEYHGYTYNDDDTVKKEHCVINKNSPYEETYDLEYIYTYKSK